MPNDNVPTFTANPAIFIVANPIVLDAIAENMPGHGFPVLNNQRSWFTLSTRTVNGHPGPNDFPSLRMQPGGVPPAGIPLVPPVVPGLSGGMFNTLLAYYCHAGNGGTAFNALPFVDIPALPGANDARYLFTTGMNGCALVVATAVPAGAPPLAPGQWRVMHDHDHRALALWNGAGYTLRFASYADPNDAGPVPAWANPPVVNTYNPHNYAWNLIPPPPPLLYPPARVVTNFLAWTGAHWTFNSRHYHTAAGVTYEENQPPAIRSTQTVAL